MLKSPAKRLGGTRDLIPGGHVRQFDVGAALHRAGHVQKQMSRIISKHTPVRNVLRDTQINFVRLH